MKTLQTENVIHDNAIKLTMKDRMSPGRAIFGALLFIDFGH